MRNRMQRICLVGFVFVCGGCAPTLYLIDRPTILEEQAAGDWHDLERETEPAVLKNKPEAFAPHLMGRGGERVLQTLPGEPPIKGSR